MEQTELHHIGVREHRAASGSLFSVNRDLPANAETTVVFTANSAGLFEFYCKYHLPEMVAQLVALG